MEVEEDGSLFSEPEELEKDEEKELENDDHEENEREMEVEGDCSQWHHLIFCEELQNNAYDDQKKNHVPVCSVCYEALVLGRPAYKCLECNFLRHKSCPESPHIAKVELYHKYWSERHHLIAVEEEVDNTGNEEVVCTGCQEPAFGPAYKCSIPNCTFCLHKSCSEQLYHVIQHPFHPEHALILQNPSNYNNCVACGKTCDRSFFYRCFLCDFDFDVICASRWRTDADDCHQHSFVPISTQIQFACQACGEDEEEPKQFASLCTICRLLIHAKCARYPRTIRTYTHDHSLTLTHSLNQQVKNQENIWCRLCSKKVKTEYSAYYCQKCGYIAHLNCAYTVRHSGATTESVVSNSVGYESHLVHLVEGIDLAEEETADPREINHFSHPQHNLILSNEKLVDVKRCEACIQHIISTPFYGCAQCNFFLHYRCTKLPATIKRGQFHEHLLTLLSHDVNASGLFWCNACGRDHDGFVYGCDKCKWYKLDVKCCLIPEIIEHEGHQHSLYLLAIESSETCNGCGKKGVNFRCPYCDEFTLCFRCPTLPLIARYEYDTHLLKLSYTREDESDEEYYCLICEEEREHPDHWFYFCVKCKFTAHSRCVLGENPCINYGRTFTDKDHEHPLTIVQKTKHSLPCDACGGSFHDVAVECTECKFNIHEYCGKNKLENRE
jgi:hypothetical protein